jgi:hypothetical protein
MAIDCGYRLIDEDNWVGHVLSWVYGREIDSSERTWTVEEHHVRVVA